MTFKQAAARAKVLFGKAGHVSEIPNAPDKAERESRRAKRAEIKAVGRKLTAAEQRELETLQYRCTVGVVISVGGFAFCHVKGQGDTWEEAFAAAERTAE